MKNINDILHDKNEIELAPKSAANSSRNSTDETFLFTPDSNVGAIVEEVALTGRNPSSCLLSHSITATTEELEA